MRIFLVMLGLLLPARTAAADELDTKSEIPAPRVVDGWPEHYPVQLLFAIDAVDAGGNRLSFSRGYLFHRLDVERVSINAGKLKRCNVDLGACETREAEVLAQGPPFWDTTLGTVLKIGLGFAAGVGVTIGVVYAVGG